jgi:outer membrane protein insertion porin family
MKRRFSTLFLALVLALPAIPTASLRAQIGGGPTIRQIDVEFVGTETISKERVLANLATQVGEPYSERTVEEDIRNLYATGTLSNVRIFGEPMADGVRVTVLLQGRPVISEVLIEGATVIGQSKLRKEIGLKPGDALNEERLEEGRRAILKLYEDRNYAEVDVQYKIEDLPDNRSRVVFSVSEGPKLVVRKITFVGNYSVKEGDLKKAMTTKTWNLLSFFNKSGRLVPSQLEADRLAIRRVYQNRGFADVTVSDADTVAYDKDSVELVFTIQEGIEYRVNSVTIEGVNIVPVDEVRGTLKMVEGELFTPNGLTADLTALGDFYGARGYIDRVVLPEITPAGEGAVDVNYSIDEGIQSYVNLVNIQGNTRTKDIVIRRELAVTPGEIYDTTLVDVSRQRLANLNYFQTEPPTALQLVPSDTLVPGRKDLNVIVEEKRTGSFNFGAGFSTIDSLIGFAELQQSNFDITNWPRFTGGGQRFRIRAQYGVRRRDFIISFTEPWFLGYQLALTTEAFYRDANFLSTVYNQSNVGVNVGLRKALTNFISIEGEYRIEQIRIFDVDNDAGQIIQDAEGTYDRSGVTGSVNYDSRDSLFLTRKGLLVRLTGFVAGGPLGGTVNDYGINLEGAQFFSLPWDMILQFKGSVAVVDGFGDTSGPEGVPLFDRLYLGGANNLRGFDFRDVGPKDDQGNALGGSSLAYGTVELSFPIIPRIRGSLFYDVGFVNAGFADFSTSGVNSDIGLGLRVELPIGPVRIDYGIPIDSDEFNDSTGKFNFNVGYQF